MSLGRTKFSYRCRNSSNLSSSFSNNPVNSTELEMPLYFLRHRPILHISPAISPSLIKWTGVRSTSKMRSTASCSHMLFIIFPSSEKNILRWPIHLNDNIHTTLVLTKMQSMSIKYYSFIN